MSVKTALIIQIYKESNTCELNLYFLYLIGGKYIVHFQIDLILQRVAGRKI